MGRDVEGLYESHPQPGIQTTTSVVSHFIDGAEIAVGTVLPTYEQLKQVLSIVAIFCP
jgi:hypothetical protein